MNSTKITSCFVGNPLWPIMNLMNIKRGKEREGGGRGKGMEANTFQPRCVAFTWRFVTLNNGTMASVFVPLICLCVSASSLSAPAIESRQLKNNCWLHGPAHKGEVLRWIPNYQPGQRSRKGKGLWGNNGQVKGRISRETERGEEGGVGGFTNRPEALPLSSHTPQTAFPALKTLLNICAQPRRGVWHMN